MPRSKWPRRIICDLSDVLIKGLRGVEVSLSGLLGLPEKEISDSLYVYDFSPLWLGKKSEDDFLAELISRTGWQLDTPTLKRHIRDNFTEIDGTRDVYSRLARKRELALLSVNAREWAEFMESRFRYQHLFSAGVFYSYQIGFTKREAGSFAHVVRALGVPPRELLFIDDSKRFVDMAATVGIRGILFENSQKLQSDLDEIGV
ncbi:MAG: hypothetical protein A2049_10440 [Elusimicrobia bacterium GWA2_62_23]|nr:MAG: hypothetical protein A2049_10440 [Elusimicrobia bacterium GWA2_62_23]